VFTGWKNSAGTFFAANASLLAVTKKETYTAQYSYTNDMFLITLNNVDGAGASWSGKFGEGSTPFYNRDNNDIPVAPSKPSTAQYTYPFTGWTPTMVPVAGTATYTAVFGQENRVYTVTLHTNGGINNEDDLTSYTYGTGATLPTNVTKEDKLFGGWYANSYYYLYF